MNRILNFLQAYTFETACFFMSIILLIFVTLFVLEEPTVPMATETGAMLNRSVLILDQARRTGGSGVVLRSSLSFSEILTNEHVCRLLEGGGFVIKDGDIAAVDAIKKYGKHDLCLVRVFKNYLIQTKVATVSPKMGDEAISAGHPALLPTLINKGHLSSGLIIPLVASLRKCLQEDFMGPEAIYCITMGGIPIVKLMNAKVSSVLVMPGSSGSPVFNSDNEISNLVFAGRGRDISFGMLVPHAYIVDFLKRSDDMEYVSVKVEPKNTGIRATFKIEAFCKAYSDKDVLGICKIKPKHLIWRAE